MYSVPGHNKYDLTYSIQKLEPTLHRGQPLGRAGPHSWVSAHYAAVEYRGVTLLLKRDSAEVKWDLLPTR